MSGSKYVDIPSSIQVIGGILQHPSFLDDEGKYFFNEEDFINDMQKVVFGAIYNLYKMGAKNITAQAIDDYLSSRPKSYGIYQANRGAEWITNTFQNIDLANFDYYYSRVKKMTLLRGYDNCGLDVSWIYDPDNLFDINKKQSQENYLDSLTLNEIAELIEEKIDNIRRSYIDNATDEAVRLGDSVFDILEELQQSPDMGSPLYGKYINTITRGARLKKFYLRSAASGVGKSRSLMADACYIACNKIYKNGEWIDNGLCQPTIFISTELDVSELTTMALAFLADVNEEHILNNSCSWEEVKRVQEAAKILQQAPLYIEELPDFSLRDIENTIKRNIRVNGCQYVILDYIHTSMKILEEISSRSGGVRLREDNVLFLLSVKLKDICNEFGVFILSATQLNQDWKTSEMPDQNLLRGAKSIADKIDIGMILLDVTDEDKTALENLINQEGYTMPNVKMSIYKNRRGSYNKCYLWMNADKSTCRFNPIFCTSYNYTPIPIAETVIEVSMNGGGK